MAEHGHSDDEIARRLDAPPDTMLRDSVYGAIDGAVTTFAIVAGVAGAGLSPFVVVALGLANVIADGFSMAAANYSGTKAEVDNARRMAEIERRAIAENPAGERREARAILARLGLSGQTLDDATAQVTSNREAWIALMLEGEYGMGRVDANPLRAAIVTFTAFLVAGMVPLLPFLIGMSEAFVPSAVMTLVGFFLIGTAKSFWSLAPWWRSGLETLAIGGVAASLAFVVGRMFEV